MKLNFGKYTYFDDSDGGNYNYQEKIKNKQDSDILNINKTYAFDETKFNNYISNRQYEDAANYASMYHFNDPEKQRQHENSILNLRRNGRILGAIYSRITDNDALAQVEFYDKVFIDGGLETLNNNKYAQDFVKWKRNLGSDIDENGNITKEATSYAIKFKPEKQTLFGIDWLKEDNENNIDNFYKETGLTEGELKANGISVINKDGATTLKFSKSNKLANKILYSVAEKFDEGGIECAGLDNKDNVLLGSFYQKEYFDKLKNLIDDTKSKKDNYFKTLDLTTKDFSSTIGPILDDNLELLQEQYNSGLIDKTTFNQQYRLQCSYLSDFIKTVGSGNIEMYSNGYNDNSGNETLALVSEENKGAIRDMISNADMSTVHLNSMISNGKLGVLVTIDAKDLDSDKAKKLDKNSNPDDYAATRRQQIFITGRGLGNLNDMIQAKINRDTSVRAIQEINDMQDWGYNYITTDRCIISYAGNGVFLKDNKEISKEEAIHDINKSSMIEDLNSNLKYNYLNKDNKLINPEKFIDKAQNSAIACALELNKDTELYRTDGTKYDLNDPKELIEFKNEVFSHINLWDKDILYNTIDENYASNINYNMYKTVSDILDIYNSLLGDITYYNPDSQYTKEY